MKKIFLATMVLALTSGMTLTAVQASARTAAVAAQSPETPVKAEELPDAVKTTLSGDAYKGWTVSSASLVKENNSEYYKIVLMKDQEKKEVKMDKDGKEVK